VLILLKSIQQAYTMTWYITDPDGSSGLTQSKALEEGSASAKKELAVRETASAPKGGDSKLTYLLMVNAGYVLTYQASSKPSVVTAGLAAFEENEKWIVEYGDEPNTVALKSSVNGKYLTGDPKKNTLERIFLRDDKQWWKLRNDIEDKLFPPGAYAFAMVEHPNWFLSGYKRSYLTPGKTGWEVFLKNWGVSCSPHFDWNMG
jgi:hypothetical protein